jgi:hypothetical protein
MLPFKIIRNVSGQEITFKNLEIKLNLPLSKAESHLGFGAAFFN